jgi:hypothetical protein
MIDMNVLFTQQSCLCLAEDQIVMADGFTSDFSVETENKSRQRISAGCKSCNLYGSAGKLLKAHDVQSYRQLQDSSFLAISLHQFCQSAHFLRVQP